MSHNNEHWTLQMYKDHLSGKEKDESSRQKKVRTHWEQQDALSLVRWFDLTYPHLTLNFFHIANEACAPIGRHVGGILKGMGVRSGSSDYFLAVARSGYNGLFIELKATPPHDSPLTKNQASCLQAYRDYGYRAEHCKGWHDAMNVIYSYLNGHPVIPLELWKEHVHKRIIIAMNAVDAPYAESVADTIINETERTLTK